jgi:hypothetical protein
MVGPRRADRADMYGIHGGPLSHCNRPGHSLVLGDLDHPLAVALADYYLLPTDMMEGRDGKPNDHRGWCVPNATIPEWAWSMCKQGAPAAIAFCGHPGPRKRAFNHVETGERLIDLIGTGSQVVCPCLGNPRVWTGGVPGVPAVVPFMPLWDSLCQLSIACGGKDLTPHAQARRKSYVTVTTDLEVPCEHIETDEILLERIKEELAKCKPAISGRNGHSTLLHAARIVCWGFARDVDEGVRILKQHYNERCEPPWSEWDLRHKCEDASRPPYNRPKGWLLVEDTKERQRVIEESTAVRDDKIVSDQKALRLIAPPTPEQVRAREEAYAAARRQQRRMDELSERPAVKRHGCGLGETRYIGKHEDDGHIGGLFVPHCGRHDCQFCWRRRQYKTSKRAARCVLYLPEKGRLPRLDDIYVRMITWKEWPALNLRLRRLYGTECGRLHVRMVDDLLLVVCQHPFAGAEAVKPYRVLDRVTAAIEKLNVARHSYRQLGAWKDRKRPSFKLYEIIPGWVDAQELENQLRALGKRPWNFKSDDIRGRGWRSASREASDAIVRELKRRCPSLAHSYSGPNFDTTHDPPPEDPPPWEDTGQTPWDDPDPPEWGERNQWS